MADTISRAGAAMGGGAHGKGVALAYMAGMLAKTSFVNAIDDVFIITALLTLVALVPALFLKKGAPATTRGAAVAE